MFSFTKPPYRLILSISLVLCILSDTEHSVKLHVNHMFCVWAVQVVSYVLQGRLEEARQMLVKQATLQPAARNMYKLMDTLLSKMPFYNVRSSIRSLSYCVALVGPGKTIFACHFMFLLTRISSHIL